MLLKNEFSFQKKSKIKAGEGKKEGRYPFFTSSDTKVLYIDDFLFDNEAVILGTGGMPSCNYYNGKFAVSTDNFVLTSKGNILTKVLYYFLRNNNLSILAEGFHGAGLKHIGKDYIENIDIPFISKQNQIKLVTELDGISELIKNADFQIQKLDELVKSRFIEMFGGPDENPYNWEVVTINDVCSSIVRGPFGSALKKDFFVEKDDSTVKVYEQQHAIKKNANLGTYYITQEKYKTLKRFECVAGDIIMSCSGTMGELYQLPVGCERGIINQALCKFTLNKRMLPRVFLEYMKYVVEQMDKKGSGIRNIAAVSYVKAMKLCLPPIDIQSEFVDFYELIDKSKFVRLIRCLYTFVLIKKYRKKAECYIIAIREGFRYVKKRKRN